MLLVMEIGRSVVKFMISLLIDIIVVENYFFIDRLRLYMYDVYKIYM